MSAVGNDARSGVNLNNAVLTLPAAAALCTVGGASSSTPYVIECGDSGILPALTDSATLPAYVSFRAPNANMQGALTISEGCEVDVGTISGAVTFRAQAASAVPSRLKLLSNASSATILATGANSNRWHVDFAEWPAGNMTVGAGQQLILAGPNITSTINATGSGALVDLRGVSAIDPNAVVVNTVAGSSVMFPANFGTLPGTAAGLMKCTGYGQLAVASAGTDYLVGTQNLTMNSDVLATGALTGTISSTIANSAVTLSKMANLSSMSVIGNPTGGVTTPSAVVLSSDYSSSSVAYRDATGNFCGQHLTQSYVKVSSFASPLTVTSPAMINYSGLGRPVRFPCCLHCPQVSHLSSGTLEPTRSRSFSRGRPCTKRYSECWFVCRNKEQRGERWLGLHTVLYCWADGKRSALFSADRTCLVFAGKPIRFDRRISHLVHWRQQCDCQWSDGKGF